MHKQDLPLTASISTHVFPLIHPSYLSASFSLCAHSGPGHLGSESRALNLGQLFHFQTELLLNITLWKKIKEFNCLIKIEHY